MLGPIVLLDLMNTAGSRPGRMHSAQLLQLLKSVPAGQPTALFVLTRNAWKCCKALPRTPRNCWKVTKLLSPSNSQLLTTMVRSTSGEWATLRIMRAMAAPQGSSGSGGSPAYSTDAIAYGQASRLSQWLE